MALTDRQEALLEGLFKQKGDSEMRRALLQLVSDNQALASGVGTPAADGVAVEEFGDGLSHTTKLTLTDFALGDSGDDEDLAIGAKVYSLPSGDIMVESSSVVGSFNAETDEATIGDGEYGIGNVVGAGAVDTLGEVDAGAENVMTGVVLSSAEFDGAEVQAAVAAQALLIAAGDPHDLFLNVAATWPDVTAAGAVTFTGVVTLKWRKIS